MKKAYFISTRPKRGLKKMLTVKKKIQGKLPLSGFVTQHILCKNADIHLVVWRWKYAPFARSEVGRAPYEFVCATGNVTMSHWKLGQGFIINGQRWFWNHPWRHMRHYRNRR